MIVLDALDRSGTRVRLVEPEESVSRAARDIEAVQGILATLGLAEVELQGPESNAVDPELMVDHQWSVLEGALEYHVNFPHAVECGATISRYMTVALSTCGCADERWLSELRLSIYEICMNSLIHGRPTGEDTKLRIVLRFEADRVVGWIEDECEPFDMTQVETQGIDERVRSRARGGYGILLIRKSLSELRHEQTETGNRVYFVKKMNP